MIFLLKKSIDTPKSSGLSYKKRLRCEILVENIDLLYFGGAVHQDIRLMLRCAVPSKPDVILGFINMHSAATKICYGRATAMIALRFLGQAQ